MVTPHLPKYYQVLLTITPLGPAVVRHLTRTIWGLAAAGCAAHLTRSREAETDAALVQAHPLTAAYHHKTKIHSRYTVHSTRTTLECDRERHNAQQQDTMAVTSGHSNTNQHHNKAPEDTAWARLTQAVQMPARPDCRGWQRHDISCKAGPRRTDTARQQTCLQLPWALTHIAAPHTTTRQRI
jgi:hypothetical protein